MNDFGNLQIKNLPIHLRQYIVDQHYEKYTAVDQAIWRYVMRQNYRYLKDVAYYPYIKGLAKAGLSIDRIPDLWTMNQHLGLIGWGAVTVDGFIPPVAFMEFQAYKVLVIAADIRQLNHIQYTPTPDIIHESAGHAPIIADPDYANYLCYFGEIGSKAMFSLEDFELYDAIRQLSILKEMPGADPQEIKRTADRVAHLQGNMGEPSEMALLSRLHWWTVEYGLIGSPENPKIYGAGLLSSIGESVNCMKPSVIKKWYTPDAVHTPFDITAEQPQLFVTPDFPHLLEVLNDFASKMSFRTGGLSGLKKAKACKNISTLVLSSGLQISGVLHSFQGDVQDGQESIDWIEFEGSCAFAFENKELPGLGKNIFKRGLVFPFGKRWGSCKAPEKETRSELEKANIETGKQILYRYKSGLQVEGLLVQTIERKGNILFLKIQHPVITNSTGDCVFTSSPDSMFYLPLGEKVNSVFNGAADKDAFLPTAMISETINYVPKMTPEKKKIIHLYAQVQQLRDRPGVLAYTPAQAMSLWVSIEKVLDESWLCALEMLEYCELPENKQALRAVRLVIEEGLSAFANQFPVYRSLIEDGLLAIETKNEFSLEGI